MKVTLTLQELPFARLEQIVGLGGPHPVPGDTLAVIPEIGLPLLFVSVTVAAVPFMGERFVMATSFGDAVTCPNAFPLITTTAAMAKIAALRLERFM